MGNMVRVEWCATRIGSGALPSFSSVPSPPSRSPPSPSRSPLSVSSRNPLPAPREAHSSLPASYGEEAGGVTWCRAPLHPAERLRSANWDARSFKVTSLSCRDARVCLRDKTRASGVWGSLMRFLNFYQIASGGSIVIQVIGWVGGLVNRFVGFGTFWWIFWTFCCKTETLS